MKVDFNVPQRDLKGNPIKDASGKEILLADTIADFLASESKGNTRKIGGWIDKLVKSEPLELDDADFKSLMSIVDDSERMIILGKKQILSVMDEAKEMEK